MAPCRRCARAVERPLLSKFSAPTYLDERPAEVIGDQTGDIGQHREREVVLRSMDWKVEGEKSVPLRAASRIFTCSKKSARMLVLQRLQNELDSAETGIGHSPTLRGRSRHQRAQPLETSEALPAHSSSTRPSEWTLCYSMHALSVIDLERRAVLPARFTAQSFLYREILGRCSISTIWGGFCVVVDPSKAGEVL